MNKYYPGEPVNINIKSLINIIQENNWVITTKKRVRVNYHYFVVMQNGQFPSMVPLISALHIFSFQSHIFQYLSIISTRCSTDKIPKEKVHFFKTIMIHPSTAPLSYSKLKRVSKVYYMQKYVPSHVDGPPSRQTGDNGVAETNICPGIERR